MEDRYANMRVAMEQGRLHEVARNVEQIRIQATRVINGRIPAQARKELSAAVKQGLLGRLKKDGLKPEIFFHPDHLHGAIERQKREAEYSIKCIASVMCESAEIRDGMERMGVDVLQQVLENVRIV